MTEKSTKKSTLIDPEKQVIRWAEALIATHNIRSEQDFTTLLEHYKKLHKKLNHVITISDMQQNKLNTLRKNLVEKNTALQHANVQLEGLSIQDGLTGIANRRCFDNFLEKEWVRLTRQQQPISLIMIDIDFFKRYNDTYGHQSGDTCLQKVAVALRTALKRRTDLVARYGGEEFVIVLPETNSQGAKELAEAARKHINQLNIFHGSSATCDHVTISAGVATMIPNADTTPISLIYSADQALYQAKNLGRDCVILGTAQ